MKICAEVISSSGSCPIWGSGSNSAVFYCNQNWLNRFRDLRMVVPTVVSDKTRQPLTLKTVDLNGDRNR